MRSVVKNQILRGDRSVTTLLNVALATCSNVLFALSFMTHSRILLGNQPNTIPLSQMKCIVSMLLSADIPQVSAFESNATYISLRLDMGGVLHTNLPSSVTMCSAHATQRG